MYFSVYVSSCCHIVAELLFKSVGVLSCWGGGVSELGGAGSRALEPRGRGGEAVSLAERQNAAQGQMCATAYKGQALG